VEVDVEVVDAALEYNLLLGCNWTYAMTAVVFSIFCTLCFPHNVKNVMIDLLSFAYAIPNASVGSWIHVIDNSQLTTENIGVRMYSSIMGTFDFVAPIHHIYAMSSRYALLMRSIPFHTLYFNDPWTLPSLIASCEGQSHNGMDVPLLVAEIAYRLVLDSFVNPDLVSLQTDEDDLILKPMWATSSS